MRRAMLCSAALTLALIAVAVTVLAQASPEPRPASPEVARVRFIHAVLDAPNVDVVLNDGELFTGTGFAEITYYSDIAPGTYTVTLRPTGTDTPILSATISVTATDYTLTAVADDGDIDLLLLTDDNSDPSPGMVRARFVHLVPDAPVAVDIAIKDGPVLFSDLDFKDVGDYQEIAAGTYELEIRVAGTEVVLGSMPLTVIPDRVYTFFAMGSVLDLQAVISIDNVDGPAECIAGPQDSGAEYLICRPASWEAGDDLLVYAHGYMEPDRDIEIPQEQMVIDGVSITETATFLGYGFATTSYSENGLAVLPAIDDLLDVVHLFTSTWGTPRRVYLLGVSEGGLITTLSMERHADIYDGGLAMCGPYGSFQGQVNHFGDFRIVFDYFFPDLMPGSPVTITTEVVEAWEAGLFTDTIRPEVEAPENAISVTQLLTVTSVSPYTYDPPVSTDSIQQLLWYNVYATENAKEKLGGQPFDNIGRWYSGSHDDTALNDEVERIAGDAEAMDVIDQYYQPTGHLGGPLVTLHTTGDEVVPYWHAPEYAARAAAAGRGYFHSHFRVDRHGHCDFELEEILRAFVRLAHMVDYPYRIALPVTLRGHP